MDTGLADLTQLKTIHDLFWHRPAYILIYALCLLSLVIFRKKMERGRRFFLLFSVICLVVFIYNPVFVNLSSAYLLGGSRVLVRLFLLLPLMFTEAYVFASIVITVGDKRKVFSALLTFFIAAVLFYIGITPWQRKEKGWPEDMYLKADNLYKIPQEHIDICEMILNDMDGDRALLSLSRINDINDIGGSLSYSIRMYTSRIQLKSVMEFERYAELSPEDRETYWESYIMSIQDLTPDSSGFYFLFPVGDERCADLIGFGCEDMGFSSGNYVLLKYTPSA